MAKSVMDIYISKAEDGLYAAVYKYLNEVNYS